MDRTIEKLLLLANQQNWVISSMDDLLIFEHEMLSSGVIYDCPTVDDLEYKLYLIQKENDDLNNKINELNSIEGVLKRILNGVERLTDRLPKPISSYKDKRAKQKAIAKDQVNRKLCVD
ncbi:MULTISPECIES: hypothetical protein [unclassified Pedobacter]|uniref:hypothetical protein n=1 Tax=unclassified Pedobacter TaxID=2628915 RepID=UPI001D33267F|nr:MULTISPECIES: hypothetical protein [unclassified Pedobacter]CAH0186375.1 hypothetical protein SRABI36_01637 [Pedobacter sp. Bi36]CAH0242126.1 hypothetical protein SRABI126_02730 [Pedobacter sp. Bi126]